MLQKLAHYQIIELLGEGSFAWVYRAFDPKFEQEVALKILKPVWRSDPKAVERFKQEAATIRKLRHPNIIDVFDVEEADGAVYMAMLLVEGETLAQCLARGPLPWNQVLKIIGPIAEALDYAHAQKVIHRDIKPANILLGANDEAYLGDFGLIRAAEGSTHLSSTVSMIGTAHYMASELWDGQTATPASDVYALTCVLFEMITGNVLFEGSSMTVVIKKHIVGPQLPESWPKGVPKGITEVLRRGLTDDPAARIQSAGELVALLSALPSFTETSPMTLASSEHKKAVQEYKTEPKEPAISEEMQPAPRISQPLQPTPPGNPMLKMVVVVVAVVTLFIALCLGLFASPLRGLVFNLLTPTATVAVGVPPISTSTSPPTAATSSLTRTPTPTDNLDAEATANAEAAETRAAILTLTASAPTLTPIPTLNTARINQISIENGHYRVDFEAFGFQPTVPGQHVHFFYDTVTPANAGFPGSGPWQLYPTGPGQPGNSPFTLFSPSTRPNNATQICILVANLNHSVNLDTGNCVDLP